MLAEQRADTYGVEHRELGKRPRDLERARDAGLAQARRRKADRLRAVEPHAAAVGPEESGDHGEERRLACPIRTHDPVHAAARHAERHVRQRLQAAETLAYAVDFEDRAHCRLQIDTSPPGNLVTTTMRMIAYRARNRLATSRELAKGKVRKNSDSVPKSAPPRIGPTTVPAPPTMAPSIMVSM